MKGWKAALALSSGFLVGTLIRAQQTPESKAAAAESTPAAASEKLEKTPVSTPAADKITVPTRTEVSRPVSSLTPVSESDVPVAPAKVAESPRKTEALPILSLGAAPPSSSELAAAAKLSKKVVSKKAVRKRVVARNRKRSAPPRMPASIGGTTPLRDLQTFSEATSFEAMVRDRTTRANRDPAAFTPSARVIAVRRELGLTDADANAAPQDIILNAGSESGLDEGMVLSVARSVPILDPYRENQQKQLEIEFAKIKIVRAEQGLAVARMEKVESIRSGLAVGTRAVLIGDYVGKFTK
ncbi:MAG: hypothetical protein JST16_06780 [Bdellovibrionales bacterium]|nr:hypothetical protein [Bdellovibrionales bacterium]